MRAFVFSAIALALLGEPAVGQVGSSVQFPAGWAPSTSVCVKQVDGKCLPVDASTPLPTSSTGKQEALQLATANSAAPAQAAFGGSYIWSQTCASYGSVALQVLGPDGSTWQTVATRTVADTSGGSAVDLGSGATVRVTLSGTNGCYASLSRVPA